MENKAPDAFRTISEVAEELDLPQHVLRFWETRFRDIKPMKRGGGRRYYRPDDIELLRGIRHLLYGEGYTIRGVQRILREHGAKFVQVVWQEGAPQPPHGAGEDEEYAVESESAVEALQEDRGLRGRLTSLIGRDLGDQEDDAPRRQEPPLRGAPEPQIEETDRAIHGAEDCHCRRRRLASRWISRLRRPLLAGSRLTTCANCKMCSTISSYAAS